LRLNRILLVAALALALIAGMLLTLYGVKEGKIKTRHGAYGAKSTKSHEMGA